MYFVRLIKCAIEEICKSFPFFPNLHRLLSSKPNMRPPAITTGVGPRGRQVVHLRPPKRPLDSVVSTQDSTLDPDVIDPTLVRADDTFTQSDVPSSSPPNTVSDSDSSQAISGWSVSSGYQDFDSNLSQHSQSGTSASFGRRTQSPLSLGFSTNSKPSSILTQFPSDSIFGDDKENVSPVKLVRTPSKPRYGDPLLASAITTAEKNMGPAANKRWTPLEESLISMHS